MEGRFILNKDLRAAVGLATDEVLAHSVGRNKSEPTLHLYNYLPSVMVGRYQNIASCVRLDRCEVLGIEVNRRATGGGTVFMSPDQLALGLFLPTDFPGLPPSIQGAFELLAAGLARALGHFGLEAEFVGKNDLTVNGKKIAGLAISKDLEGVTFFHTSLLLGFDLKTMLDILNLPTQKMLDRGISCFGQRMTTIRQETAGQEIALPQVHEAVRRGLEEQLSVRFSPADLTLEEQFQVEALLQERYANEEWIYRARSPKKRMGFAEGTTPGGLVQVHLSLSGGVIETVLITGDYFSRTRDVTKLESILKYCRADREGLQRQLEKARATDFIHRVDLPMIVELILKAVADARDASRHCEVETRAS